MGHCIAVTEGVVGHNVQTGFNRGVKAFVQGGEVAHGIFSYGFYSHATSCRFFEEPNLPADLLARLPPSLAWIRSHNDSIILMIANFLSALGGSTDSIVSSFLKPELEKHLAGIGSVQNIELDTPNKRASVILAMQGDPNPVKIQIERYSLAPSPAGSLLTIHDYSCPTHEWLAKLAKKFNPTFEISLPVPYAMASALV